MGVLRLSKAWTRYSDTARTNFSGKTFIDIEGLKKASKDAIKRKEVWLGRGFQWTDMEAQRMHALVSSGVAKTLGKEALSKDGSYWLHGLQKEEEVTAITQPAATGAAEADLKGALDSMIKRNFPDNIR